MIDDEHRQGGTPDDEPDGPYCPCCVKLGRALNEQVDDYEHQLRALDAERQQLREAADLAHAQILVAAARVGNYCDPEEAALIDYHLTAGMEAIRAALDATGGKHGEVQR